jgi:hypothetical protein
MIPRTKRFELLWMDTSEDGHMTALAVREGMAFGKLLPTDAGMTAFRESLPAFWDERFEFLSHIDCFETNCRWEQPFLISEFETTGCQWAEKRVDS